MDKNKQLGESIRRKRISLGFSRYTLGVRAGVSESVINRIETGKPIQETNLRKILLMLDMKSALEFNEITEESKALTLDELRTYVLCARDIIRESSDNDLKAEVLAYKTTAEAEILLRMREAFKGSFS